MRNLLLVKTSENPEEAIDVSSDNMKLLKEESTMLDVETLMRYIRIFSELGNQIKYATQKRILIEINVIKLCKPEMEKDYTSLVDRVDSLEKKLEKGIVVAQSQSPRQGGEVTAAEEVAKMELPKAIPDDIRQVTTNWKGILSQLTGITKTYLNKAVPTLGPNNCLLLVFEDPNAYEYISENRSECQDSLKMMIADRIGKEVELQVKHNDTGHASEEVYPDLRQLINIEIEEDDF